MNAVWSLGQAMRDATDVENGIEIFEGIESGVVAEGALAAKFVEVHVAFQNDFRVGRDFEVNGFAFHQLNWLLAEKSGNEIFLNVGRGRHDGGEGESGIGADGNGDFHFSAAAFAFDEHRAARGASHDVNRGR